MSNSNTAILTISPIPLNKIDEDVSNHRLVSDPASDEQLLDSIQANGVQQPIKVTSKGDGRFTLVFGFRRKAAAEKAGLKSIPAIVEQDLDTNTIRQLQAIENLERKELHPLEEAEFCHELAASIDQDHGASTIPSDLDVAEAVSQRIGRSKKWVEHRLSMARLSDRVKQAFLDGDIHLGHAQQIARLSGHELQEEVLGFVKASVSSWLTGEREKRESRQPPATIADTRALVEQRMRDLSSVAWTLEAEFADKVACTSCPHNTSNRMDLFDGDQPKKPQCLDASCYAEKTKVASRAVVRATNTLIKSEAKHTVPQARKAITEREVEFIEPKAVVAAAKRRANPEKTTPAEARGARNHEQDWKIQHELRGRSMEWREEIYREINEYLPYKSAETLAMMIIIKASGLLDIVDPRPYQDISEGMQNEARKAFCEALELMKGDFTDDVPAREFPLVRFVELMHRWMNDVVVDSDVPGIEALGLDTWSSQDHARQALCAAYNIDTKPFGPKPTYESIKAELYPDEKPKPKSKAKAKKGKKAATT